MIKRLWAILMQRCPVCLRGNAFKSLLEMNKTCPHCGLVFEREHGYFLNAMFVAYCVGFLILLPSSLLLARRAVSVPFFAIAITLEVILLWPLIFRYSRVIWMHVDQTADPRVVEDRKKEE